MAKVCTVICQESDLMFNDITDDIYYYTILKSGTEGIGAILNETYSFNGNEEILMVATRIDGVNIPLVCMQLTSNGAYYFNFETGTLIYSSNRNFQYDVNIAESNDFVVTSNPANMFESIIDNATIPIEYGYTQDYITFANLKTSASFAISGESTPSSVNMVVKTSDGAISDNNSITDGGAGEIVIFNRDNKAFAIGYHFTSNKDTIVCGIMFLTTSVNFRSMITNKKIAINVFVNDYQIRAVDRWYAYYSVELNYPDGLSISVDNT